MHTLSSYISDVSKHRKNTPDGIEYSKNKKYKFDSKYARAFIYNSNSGKILWSEPTQVHNDILMFISDKDKTKFGLADDVFFIDELYNDKQYKHFKCGRIWVIPNKKSKNRNYDVYIAWWNELTQKEFNTFNKSIVDDYNKLYNTDILSYMVVDNNGKFILVADGDEIEITAADKKRKNDLLILRAIHLASSEEKHQYMKAFLKNRNDRLQRELYNHTKSKTAAEYNNIKTIGDSLEINNNIHMKSLLDFILENQKITMKGAGASQQNYGNCIILAGGPGSGKGFIQDKILCNFAVVDVDNMKKRYIAMAKAGKIKDNTEYDLRNPEDVGKLHMAVKNKGWKGKQRELFWKQREMHDAHSSKLQPNILWDMVSDSVDDVFEVAVKAKAMGYTVTLVWVVCNKETAEIGNEIRDRRVKGDVIEKGHAGAYKAIMSIFNNEHIEITELVDRAWIGFSAGYGRMLEPKYAKDPVIQVKSSSENEFKVDNALVNNFLDHKQPIDYDFVKKCLASKDAKKREQAEMWVDIVGDEYKPNGVNETLNECSAEEYLDAWRNALKEIL